MTKFEISKTKDHPESFAVCLVGVPDFPVQSDNIDAAVRTPVCAVVGAVLNRYKGWSFINLTQNEKHIIGDSLTDHNANFDEWWWCTQFV